MPMTRRDYIAVTEAVRAEKALNRQRTDRSFRAGGSRAIESLTRRLADIMEAGNPNFNRQKFLAECERPTGEMP